MKVPKNMKMVRRQEHRAIHRTEKYSGMPDFPNVEINQKDDLPDCFSVKIDGKEFDTVQNIDISMGVGKISTVKLEFCAKVNFKGTTSIERVKNDG